MKSEVFLGHKTDYLIFGVGKWKAFSQTLSFLPQFNVNFRVICFDGSDEETVVLGDAHGVESARDGLHKRGAAGAEGLLEGAMADAINGSLFSPC